MRIKNIIEAKKEAKRFLKRIKEIEESDSNSYKMKKKKKEGITCNSKETAALKRSSMDLTRSLSKLRNDIY